MPIEWAMKEDTTPKQTESNKQRPRRRKNPQPWSHYTVEKRLNNARLCENSSNRILRQYKKSK